METETVEWAENFAAIGKQIAEDMGHENFIPTLFVLMEDETSAVLGMMGVPPGQMYDATQVVLSNFDNVKAIALTADTYLDQSLISKSPEDIDEYMKNWRPLVERFLEGDPNVSEGLQTIALSANLSVSIHQPYKWTPVDGWEWGEPNVMDEENGYSTNWKWDRLINGLPLEDPQTIIGTGDRE